MPAAAVAQRRRKPKTAASRDHLAIAAQFEADVISGKQPAGKFLRAAVERQRRDLKRADFAYEFVPDAGAKLCRFIERFLVHVEGAESLVGKPLILAPFQVWLLVVAWGWRHKDTGNPRFRRITMFCPKGTGKSTLCAALASYVLCTDKGASSVVSAATTRDQARLVFDFARRMLLRSPTLLDSFGVVVEEHVIKRPATGTNFKPISSEARSAEGKLPRLILEDEIHVHPSRDLHDNLRSMAAKRPDSVTVVISTAGSESEGIGFEVYGYARDILLGKIEDESQFALLLEADRDRDPWDPETWAQATPALGVSIDPIEVANEANEAKQVPSKRPSFYVKRLGWWVASSETFIDPEQWNALADRSISEDDISEADGWQVFAGVDLARTRDLTAAVVVAARTMPAEKPEDVKREYRIFTRRTYLPAESPTVNADFKRWASDGWLTLIPGSTMGLGPLKAEVKALAKRFPSLKVCVDDWAALEVENELQDSGITVIGVRQGAKSLSEPMKELEAAVLDKRLKHDGSPVAAMCIGNLQAKRDANDGIRPTRESEYKKIDIAVAIIDALYEARIPGAAPVYTAERGLFAVDFDEAQDEPEVTAGSAPCLPGHDSHYFDPDDGRCWTCGKSIAEVRA